MEGNQIELININIKEKLAYFNSYEPTLLALNPFVFLFSSFFWASVSSVDSSLLPDPVPSTSSGAAAPTLVSQVPLNETKNMLVIYSYINLFGNF